MDSTQILVALTEANKLFKTLKSQVQQMLPKQEFEAHSNLVTLREEEWIMQEKQWIIKRKEWIVKELQWIVREQEWKEKNIQYKSMEEEWSQIQTIYDDKVKDLEEQVIKAQNHKDRAMTFVRETKDQERLPK